MRRLIRLARRKGSAVGFAVKSLLVSIGVWLVLVAGLYTMQRRMLFPGNPTTPDRFAADLGHMEEFRVDTEDGLTLLSWYSPASDGRPTIVYFHGNGGNIGGRGYKANPLIDRGYGLLLVGYRGYGGNPGSPSEEGLYADARAALRGLETAGVRPSSVVLYGESLGSGVATKMATEFSVAGVVLEALYTSVVDVAAGQYWYVPVRTLMKDRFDSLDRIGDINSPVLILHGDADRIIPFEHGVELFQAATEPKVFKRFEDGNHLDLFDRGAVDDIAAFIDALPPRH